MDNTDVIVNQGIEAFGRYYSRYRAIVVDNEDPLSMNRLKVAIPDVHGGIIDWAMPVNQAGSMDSGFKYITPKIKDIVWISFECGNPSKPLWEYCGWGLEECPEELAKPNAIGIVTPSGNRVLLDDDSGQLTIYVKGDVMVVNEEGDIQLTSKKGSIFLDAAEGIMGHEGENGGLINIDQLTEKLNNLQSELEKLRTLFNQHTHTSSSPGSPTSPNLNQATSPFSKFKNDDYEDKTFLH